MEGPGQGRSAKSPSCQGLRKNSDFGGRKIGIFSCEWPTAILDKMDLFALSGRYQSAAARRASLTLNFY